MRVGLVCPYSLTLPGGVQGQVLGLARVLRARGVHAQVLGPCDGPPPAAYVTPLGNSLPTSDNGSVAPIAPDPAAALRTIRALRDEDFDVVHVHEPMAPGPSLTAAVVSASPTIATFHRAGESAWLAAFRPLARWGISHVDLRVAVSEEARAMAHEALGGDYEVLWNGIETGRYQSTPPHPGGKRAVFFVGRHESRKGLEVLIDAVGRIGGDVVLWIAGVGPDTARLRRDTAGDERFQWLGVLDEAEKISRIRGADVVCAPSLHGESFGVVLLEALAAGTPLVATDLAGYRSVVTDGVEGRLVPPGDPAALARAIGQALEGGGETAAMVEAGLLRAERFSMDSLADAYLERYERLTKP